jgi:glycosyltransferase involved in cell wall biosynthesis
VRGPFFAKSGFVKETAVNHLVHALPRLFVSSSSLRAEKTLSVIDRPSKIQAGPRLRVQAVLWNSLGPASLSNALIELLENLPTDAVERTLWALNRHPEAPRNYHRPAFPDLAFRLLCKAGIPASVQGRLGRPRALSSIRAGDIVYIWPPFDLPLIKRAQERGAIVVAERTNCMAPMAQEAISRAYARRSIPMPKGWFPPSGMAEERERMLRCDFVTANNAFVKQSLLDAGIPAERILESSYGFSPQRLAPAINIERPERPPVFAFVGSGIIGKGLDVLLEAWERAGINGRLLIAGEIDPELGTTYEHVLARPEVCALGWARDMASVYAAADVFVFPSHAEGGPLVVYEAAGCGLPSIISPMGCGRLVRHNMEGLVINPLDVDELAGAITRLAEDRGLRETLGKNARERAQKFTWQKVGARLYQSFREITEMPSRPPAPWDEASL